jgi:hypothetical protein
MFRCRFFFVHFIYNNVLYVPAVQKYKSIFSFSFNLITGASKCINTGNSSCPKNGEFCSIDHPLLIHDNHATSNTTDTMGAIGLQKTATFSDRNQCVGKLDLVVTVMLSSFFGLQVDTI